MIEFPGHCESCGEPLTLDFLELWDEEGAFILDACCEDRQEELHEGLLDSIDMTQLERVKFLKPLRELFALYGIQLRQVYWSDAEMRWRYDRGVDVRPVEQKAAKAFIQEHHRHNRAPAGWRYGAGLYNGEELVGIVWAGRAVARALDPETVVEVNRLCVRTDLDAELVWNACSTAYGWAAREAKRRGFQRIVTYTLESEDATTLKAAGWKAEAVTKGGSWNTPSRPRQDTAPTCRKVRWERQLAKR